jgi:hypothetical protein
VISWRLFPPGRQREFEISSTVNHKMGPVFVVHSKRDRLRKGLIFVSKEMSQSAYIKMIRLQHSDFDVALALSGNEIYVAPTLGFISL